MDPRVLFALRSLGADVDRLPEELAAWIVSRTPQDLERIRGDVKELERVGLLPAAAPILKARDP